LFPLSPAVSFGLLARLLSRLTHLYDRQASAFKNQRGWAEQLSGNSSFACPSQLPATTPLSTDVGTMTACSAAPGFFMVTITVRSTAGNKTFTTTPLDVVVMTP